MAAKSDENRNFSPLHRTLLYYPVGQKFAQNHSISYGFQDIHTFSFTAKIQDGHQKWRKLKFFPLADNTLEIALSLTVCEIFVTFHIFTKSSNKLDQGRICGQMQNVSTGKGYSSAMPGARGLKFYYVIADPKVGE